MPEDRDVSRDGEERWAQFRFSVVGPLLAAPPKRGELKDELARLAAKQWLHPITGAPVRFGASSIERWYYRALRERRDPLGALRRKVREDCGSFPSLNAKLRAELLSQYRQHPNWSYQLHADNLVALAEEDPALGLAPSYSVVRRFMQAHGLFKRKRRGGTRRTAGAEAAERRFEALEVRSYESAYVNGLWHLDFHGGSLPVLHAHGEYVYPQLLGVLDDHSRLCAHAQWYLAESAENLVHGFSQAIEKRGLPRSLMSDNGSAMIAAETVQGLQRLGIVHEKTLPYSPYQNGKQEVFWAQVEGRLLAMLQGCREVTVPKLNEAPQAWVECEYNRKVHTEIDSAPLARFLSSKDVGRPSPDSEALRRAFTAKKTRTQRLSDGTISVEGVRFEVPSQYRHLKQLLIRCAAWDLSHVYLVDPRSGEPLCRLYPLDKRSNAEGRRRRKSPLLEERLPEPERSGGEMAPLLRSLIARYAATGLPPAYLPKDECINEKEDAP